MVIPVNLLHFFWGVDSAEEIEAISVGHINKTYRIRVSGKYYILQTVNRKIFKNPESISRNIETVNTHLSEKGYTLELLTPVVSKYNTYTFTENDETWRAFDFIENSRIVESVNTPEQAFQAAKAFGVFIRKLSDLSSNVLDAGIPDFLDFNKRLSNFERACINGNPERLKNASSEIEMLATELTYWKNFIEKSKILPVRIIHGDAKISNILFREDLKTPICVIDLDTMMPGPAFHDLSDMIRSYVNKTAEDDPNPSPDQMNKEVLESTIAGFTSGTEDILTSPEIESLQEGIPFVTYIQALRFLTDYLQGDIYYSIRYPEHNLDRTKNQTSLYLKLKEYCSKH